MNTIVDIKILPSELNLEEVILQKARKQAKLGISHVQGYRILKRSIDARQRQAVYRLRIELFDKEVPKNPPPGFTPALQKKALQVIIVGAGPAGYFAALRCIENGLQPIIIDRGKDVQSRRRDLKAIQQDGIVNPDSNYCFGEGGAGTYSDGKLYTRSHKRGRISDILQILVDHGAKTDILIDAHPHIGSNKLPKIIAQIRESILNHGGQILFESKVVDFITKDDSIKGVRFMVNDEEKEMVADAVILATGHSARDIFQLCHQHHLAMNSKPFALGIRIEHPQRLIDEIQYNQSEREENLPASSYSVACQVKGAGVFSFCMCPGGLIVPAATSPEEIVVNGMSLSKRDSPFANSGIVAEVSTEYLEQKGYTGLFAGVEFQQKVESDFYKFGDGTQKAPAQKLTDFIEGNVTSTAMESSYIPGLVSAPVHELLPIDITQKIRKASFEFDRKLKGFLTDEAHVIGVESRTSSPIKIHRNKETYMSPSLSALFPCGEGAGYAGGILSAAIDGRNVADAVAQFLE